MMTFMGQRVLLLEAGRAVARAAVHYLERRGYFVTLAVDADEVRRLSRFDVLVIGAETLSSRDLTFAGWMLAQHRTASVVFFAHSTCEDARFRASNLGTLVDRGAGLHRLATAIAESVQEQVQQQEILKQEALGQEALGQAALGQEALGQAALRRVAGSTETTTEPFRRPTRTGVRRRR